MAAPAPGAPSFYSVCQQLRHHGEHDSYVYLSRLATKSPLLQGLGEEIEDKFQGCEAIGCEAALTTQEDGEPLVLCAIDGGIAVSLPSESIWDRDTLTVRFRELLPDESIKEASERIDNLARSVHAGPILERHRARRQKRCESGADLWARRAELFPHLRFGPDVERHLERINVLEKVIHRLADLDEAAATWTAGPAPDWSCDVSSESRTVMTTPKLLERRVFRSIRGRSEVFALHGRYGKGGRIHLRVDARLREVEIGYIGSHLPTKRYD